MELDGGDGVSDGGRDGGVGGVLVPTPVSSGVEGREGIRRGSRGKVEFERERETD